MLCGACGASLLLVDSTEEEWKHIGPKCSSEVKAAPPGLTSGLGEKLYQAFRRYQDSEYEQAAEFFFALVRKTECLDYNAEDIMNNQVGQSAASFLLDLIQ